MHVLSSGQVAEYIQCIYKGTHIHERRLMQRHIGTMASGSGDPPPRKRYRVEPRGGQVQKARWATEQAELVNLSPKSELAELLVDRWAWGALSTPVVQQIAAAAVADGVSHADVVFLSKLGTSGRHPNNMYKELTRKLKDTPLTEALDNISVWQKKANSAPVRVSQLIMLPHRAFASIYKSFPQVFQQNILGGGADEPTRFWRAVEHTDAYKNHPVSSRETHRTKAVPLALHGDAVTTSGVGKSWANSCEAYSWRSCLSRAEIAITSNFLIWMYFVKLLVKSGNLNAFKAFERKLTWSLYWLFLGRHPVRDEFGVEYERDTPEGRRAHEEVWLADGYFGVLWVLQGDLDHMSKAWGFANPGSIGKHSHPCACCGCDGDDAGKPWTDGRLDVAKWLATVWTNATWRAAFPDRSHIFKHLPGLGIEQYIPDLMRILHLGCYQYVFGSVMALLTHHHMPQTPEKNLEVLWASIKDAYKALRNRNYRRWVK